MHNTIHLSNVNVNFQQKKVLNNISFEVKPNIPKCIVGKGLSGKSTILKSIIGLVEIESGQIKIDNISPLYTTTPSLIILALDLAFISPLITFEPAIFPAVDTLNIF